MNYIRHRLNNDPAMRQAYSDLCRYGLRANSKVDRFWRFSNRLPRPLFQRAVDLLLTQSVWKQMVTRAIRGKQETCMKILSVHNSYQLPGGEDQVFAQEADLLRAHGHQVLLYQASNDQVNGQEPAGPARQYHLESRKSISELRALMHREKPDIVHVHNTFPVISPAVYYAANEEGIPVVQTLHNYRMLCPAATLFRDGHVCEDCVGKNIPWPGWCMPVIATAGWRRLPGAAMLATHNYKQTWSKTVSAYIALTGFARNKFIRGWLSRRENLRQA